MDQKGISRVLFLSLVFIPILVICILIFNLKLFPNNIQKKNKEIQTKEQSSTKSGMTSKTYCTKPTPSGYTLVATKEEEPSAIVYRADFKGDKNLQEIVFYQENAKSNILPIITEIYNSENQCQVDFSFTGKDIFQPSRSGNEFYDAKVIPDFLKTGKDGLMVINESTGYGSGFTAYINFIYYKDGKFQVIQGPDLDELSAYKLTGNYPAQEIEIVRGIWKVGVEGHLDQHKYSLEKYTWDGQKYDKKILGTTKNKYDNVSVDEIIKSEPQLLQDN